MNQDELKELVQYDPGSGRFFWKKASSNKTKAGEECGCKTKAGYVVLRLNGKLYQANQMAWLYQYGEIPGVRLRFLNGDRSDNRIANIAATNSELLPRKKREVFKPRIKKEDWIKRFVERHGDIYDYSKTVIDGAGKKVTIICRRHGEFLQTPAMHANGNGCRKCANEAHGLSRSIGLDSLLKRFAEVHGDTYDYSLVTSSKTSGKATIVCRKHGPFDQLITSHLGGCGCRICYNETIGERSTKHWGEVLADFTAVHGSRYQYIEASYKNAKAPVKIICNEHGEFEQIAAAHANGHGCPECAKGAIRKAKRKDDAYFLSKAKERGNSKYEYRKVVRSGRTTRIEIICPEHGQFLQIAGDHYRGNGCPKCVSLANPKANIEIAQFMESLGFDVLRDQRCLGDRRSIDVLVPEIGLGIEHNGLIWHSEKFKQNAKTHLIEKKLAAEERGIRCIHIFEDEWLHRNEQCKQILAYAAGRAEKLNARDCEFSIIPSPSLEASGFMDANHIQGAAKCKLYAVLRHNGRIVMAASFGQLRSNRTNSDASKWELSRMASSCVVRGGASKIMKNLLGQRSDIKHITTYYDHRLFSGGKVYEAMGFVKTHTYGPDYRYVAGDRREHKSLYQKKLIAKKFSIEMSGKTEYEAMLELGYFRIWDCGKTRYEFKR